MLVGCGEPEITAPPPGPIGTPEEPLPPDAIKCPARASRAFDARQLLSKSLQSAEELAARYDCRVRVIAVRGSHHLDVTSDYEPSRINIVRDGSQVVRLRGVF